MGSTHHCGVFDRGPVLEEPHRLQAISVVGDRGWHSRDRTSEGQAQRGLVLPRAVSASLPQGIWFYWPEKLVNKFGTDSEDVMRFGSEAMSTHVCKSAILTALRCQLGL